MHGLIGVQGFDEGMEQARLGRGGGAVGAALLALLIGALGVGGTAVTIAAWVLIGMTFTIGLSVPELIGRTLSIGRWVWEKFSPKRIKTTTPAFSTPISQPRQVPKQAEQTAPIVSPSASLDVETAEAVSTWVLPNVNEILDPGTQGKADETFNRERARLIEETLGVFGAPARVVEIHRGPTITQFGVEPEFLETRGGRRTKVKVGKIASLADDLALALAASTIRIEAPVPGKGYVGIEVPNQEVSLVALRDVMAAEPFQRIDSRLRLGLGKDVSGNAVAADLRAMPHLLIAGTTGSGKSVCVNAIISALLLQNTPDDMKLVMR